MRPVLKCKDCNYEGNEDHTCVSPDGFYETLPPVVIWELLAIQNGLTIDQIFDEDK